MGGGYGYIIKFDGLLVKKLIRLINAADLVTIFLSVSIVSLILLFPNNDNNNKVPMLFILVASINGIGSLNAN